MKKILVVDDDPDILTSVKNILTRNYYNVSTTRSCREGLDIFYEFKPDLVILDIRVGDEDGQEMCKRIKEQTDFKHLPVILFSADHEALLKNAVYGASAGIEKPFNIDKMLVLIKELLDSSTSYP